MTTLERIRWLREQYGLDLPSAKRANHLLSGIDPKANAEMLIQAIDAMGIQGESEFDLLSEAKLKALGVTPEFLNGSTEYATVGIALEVEAAKIRVFGQTVAGIVAALLILAPNRHLGTGRGCILWAAPQAMVSETNRQRLEALGWVLDDDDDNYPWTLYD